jgi:hypothetical protein
VTRLSAQDERESSTLVFPVAFYLPETRWGFGVAGAHSFYLNEEDSISPPSQIQLGFAYTQNKQFLAYLPFNLFWEDRQWQATGELGWYRYSYNFYGIGNEVDPSFVESYPIEYPRLRLHVINKIADSWYFGGRYWADYFTIQNNQLDAEGLLIGKTIAGSEGGAVMGSGLSIARDTRDDVYSTTKGGFAVFVYQDHSRFWLGDYNFTKYRLDLRGFKSLKDHIVLAGQILAIHTSGTVPFNHMGMVGGSRINRGLYEGRFRDKSMVSAQGEIRFDIWRRFDGCIFGSSGVVGDGFGDLSLQNTRYSGGAGLRYLLDQEKGVKIRLDYAWAKGSSGLYLTFGEAF